MNVLESYINIFLTQFEDILSCKVPLTRVLTKFVTANGSKILKNIYSNLDIYIPKKWK